MKGMSTEYSKKQLDKLFENPILVVDIRNHKVIVPYREIPQNYKQLSKEEEEEILNACEKNRKENELRTREAIARYRREKESNKSQKDGGKIIYLRNGQEAITSDRRNPHKPFRSKSICS